MFKSGRTVLLILVRISINIHKQTMEHTVAIVLENHKITTAKIAT
jgi:hypothetical protein